MKELALIGAAALLVYGAYVLSQQAEPDSELNARPQPEPDDSGPTLTETIMTKATSMLGLWHPPAKYAAAIARAESLYGLPPDMLARLLYQESRYREDIITGAARSPAGALGIAQFMPATAAEMGIDPLNPAQAIPAAARYLARLHASLGTWTLALAAYNWGIGNVRRKGINAAPLETRNYYAQILADINTSNGSTYA